MSQLIARIPPSPVFHFLVASSTRRLGARLLLLWLFMAGALGSASAQHASTQHASTQTEDEHAEAVEGWRQENERRLSAPDGWLALIAHEWLRPGRQSIGILPTDAVRLPAELGVSTRAELQVEDGRVFLECAEQSGFQVNDRWQPRVELRLDSEKAEADGADRITRGDRLRLQLVRRGGKLALRVRDAQSQAIARFAGKRWFPVDGRYQFQATYHAYAEPRPIRIVNVRGEETTMEIVGYAEFEAEGQRHRLDAMLESPTELFFVFRDATNGDGTYEAGRFLNAERPADGRTFDLDFNKAYNPPCAVSPHTLCPLPPRQNHLALKIRAGERAPAERR